MLDFSEFLHATWRNALHHKRLFKNIFCLGVRVAINDKWASLKPEVGSLQSF